MARISTAQNRVSEKAFQQQIVDLAKLTGWLCHHTHDSRRSEPGFPDLVLVRPPQVLFVEIKTEAGALRPEQEVWLSALRECPGVQAEVWRPSDWQSIEETLRRRRARG